MTSVPLIDQIAERVERLLVRHDELRRTNELLAQQVQALTQERDSLRSRLAAARARIDALLDRLPAEQAEVIRLHTFASMRFTEIAETLELPASTVKSRFHYGIERLKTLL